MDEKMKSILAYIFGWVGGLIVLFGLKDNARNTKIHAAQSIVISAGVFIISIIYGFIPLYIPMFSTLIWAVQVIAIIMGIIKASKEEEPELPVIADLAKNIFKKQIEEDSAPPPSGE